MKTKSLIVFLCLLFPLLCLGASPGDLRILIYDNPATTTTNTDFTPVGLLTYIGGGAGTVTSVGWTGGIVSIATATTTPAFTVAGTSGGIPYFSSSSTWATSAALAANAIVIGGGAGVAPSTTTTGTGVLTALGVNVGSAGAFVVFDGALGTPSSGTIGNSLTTATSANTASAIVARDGSGNFVAGTITAALTGTASGNLVSGGAAGTPSSINLTNGTALPVSGITSSTSTALGLGSIELGDASDTTITRVSAGVIAVEGVTLSAGAAVANPGAQVLGLTAINGVATTAMRSDGAPALNQAIVPTWTGIHTFNKTIILGSTQSAAAWTTAGIALSEPAASYTDTSSSGTVAVQAINNIAAPTLLASSATVYTDSATFRIAGPPVASTNVTQTRPHSLVIVDATSSASSVAGGFIVAATLGTASTSVAIGGGNVVAGGAIIAGSYVQAAAVSPIFFSSRSVMSSSANGLIEFLNNSSNEFTGTNYGLATNSFGRIGRDAVNGFTFQSGAGTTTWNNASTAASGTVTNRYMVGIAAPTLTATNVTVTNDVASTVYIGGAPIDSTNTTSTIKYALNVASGVTNLGGGLKGTATNDSAAAGNVGEFVSSLVAVGAPVALTTATAADVTSISLTAGDWDVEGSINYAAAAATVTATVGGISITSVTLPTDGSEVNSGVIGVVITETDGITLPRKRISTASTISVYLIGKATFSAGSVGAYGAISARRVR